MYLNWIQGTMYIYIHVYHPCSTVLPCLDLLKLDKFDVLPGASLMVYLCFDKATVRSCMCSIYMFTFQDHLQDHQEHQRLSSCQQSAFYIAKNDRCHLNS